MTEHLKTEATDRHPCRHSRGCSAPQGSRCTCRPGPSYEAFVFIKAYGEKRRKTFPTLKEAKVWRRDAMHAAGHGKLAAANRQTVKEAGDLWLEKAKSGEVRLRSGLPFKPSTLRTYGRDLEKYVYPAVGHIRLTDLRRRDVQHLLVEPLVGKMSGSRVAGAVMPLRAIVKRALRNDELAVNPTADLDLPASDGVRDRVATVAEATALLDALPVDDRAIWTTAVYAA